MTGPVLLPDPRALLTDNCQITITTNGEESTFALSRLDPKNSIVALQRFLMCSLPVLSEEMLFTMRESAKHKQSQWTKTRKAGSAPWYVFSDGRRGRSGTTPPNDIPEESIPAIDLPVEPPTELRDYFAHLVDCLPPGDKWREPKSGWVTNLKLAYAPTYAGGAVKGILTDTYIAIAGSGMAAYLNEIFKLKKGAEDGHREFLYPGFVTAELLLVAVLFARLSPLRSAGQGCL
jgi:hypothetical protein